MSDKIQPALTPEEWKTPWGGVHSARGVDQEFWLHLLGEEGNAKWLSIRLDGRVWNLREPDSFAVVMAFANAALPDDDPRKITRAKIAALRLVVADSDYMPPSHTISPEDDARRWEEMNRTFAAADELLDALEALLPPDE